MTQSSQSRAPKYRWLVLLDGPDPIGFRFDSWSKANRKAKTMKRKGYHPLIADLSDPLNEIQPWEEDDGRPSDDH